MLAILANVPRSAEEWAIFSLHHKLDHDEIRSAINSQKKLNLQLYPLDPIPTNAWQTWLINNQSAHTDMDNAMGLQSSDLEDLDPNNENQLIAWIFLHYQEHYSVRAALKI